MTSFGAKCPHCETLFKVYPDQLRLYNGYANCGVCGLAFDVQTALLSLPAHQSHFLPSQSHSIDGLPVLNAVVSVGFEPLDGSSESKNQPNLSTNSGAQG